ncbi:uncharacterized protein EAE98_009629 [Botrytis deweyae]|uniref:Uncharacterized protein n=1 Tax=Botrytis deweyae TaxID=2478750 RepID=A0ABQ7IB53_9HELO|nr:uncharacterized protein EAE98_009629 [Botrytis deweyae]KAF7918851.1 hypothetical protein EAE98_009629 [Botrytis deweyae]
MSAFQRSVKSRVVLAVDNSYRGQPTIPNGAKLWSVAIDSLDDGYAYNFTVTRSIEVRYLRVDYARLRSAFSLKRLGSYTNSVDVDGDVTFVANSLCVALQRFMYNGSHRIRGATLPVGIWIKFDDGPSIHFNTTLNVEAGPTYGSLFPGPSPLDLHRFIDMAILSMNIEIPSLIPKQVDQDVASIQNKLIEVAPISDKSYRALGPKSSLFDAYPSPRSCSWTRDKAIARMLLHGQQPNDGNSKVLVIGKDESMRVVCALRAEDVDVRFLEFDGICYRGSQKNEEFNYSQTGDYKFKGQQYDMVFINKPSSTNHAVDARQKCELISSLRKACKVKGLIILSVRSMPTISGVFDIIEIPDQSAIDEEAILSFRNTLGGTLDREDPLNCVILATVYVTYDGANTRYRLNPPDHPIYSEFFPKLSDESYHLICKRNQWSDILLARSYLTAAFQRTSTKHVRQAENPLQCYAALKVGAPSPLPIGLERIFHPSSADSIQILPPSFFSRNPRFLEMVEARYDELLDLCDISEIDAPQKIISQFLGSGSTALLYNLSKFHYMLIKSDDDDESKDYDRVLPFEAMAVLCSVSFFCILRMYLCAYNVILNTSLNAWDLQDLLWRLTAFGTWEEKRWYMVMKFQQIFEPSVSINPDDSE